MKKETQSILIRLTLAIVLISIAGILIYYVNPKSNHQTQNVADQHIEKKSDFELNIPTIKTNSDPAELKQMKSKMKDIHEQMNDIADEDGFDGASLEDKDISHKLKEVNQKLDQVKREKNNTPEFNAHIEHMQDLVESSLEGSAHSMAMLYGYVSGLDQKLNDVKAVVDKIEVTHYVTNIENDTSFNDMQQWLTDIQKQIEHGKLKFSQLKDYSQMTEEQQKQLDKYLKESKERADQYSDLVESKNTKQQLDELQEKLDDLQTNKIWNDKQVADLKKTIEKLKENKKTE